MIYLAAPYSHASDIVRHQRFEQVTKIAASLVSSGQMVFSPITHSHPMMEHAKLGAGWRTWEELDRKVMLVCTDVYVVMLPGWKESEGVMAEISLAKQMGLKVRYFLPVPPMS